MSSNSSSSSNLPPTKPGGTEGDVVVKSLLDSIEKAKSLEEKQKGIRLLLEYEKKKQDQASLTKRESQILFNNNRESQLSFLKQLLGIISGVSLVVFGPIIFVQYDPNFGTLLTSAGLANLGYSGGILKLLQRKSRRENHEV